MAISQQTILNLKSAFEEALPASNTAVSAPQRRALAALIMQDLLQGEIVDTTATLPDGKKIPHFFNKVGGRYYDMLRDELPPWTIIHVGAKQKENEPVDSRDLILAHAADRERYQAIARKVFY